MRDVASRILRQPVRLGRPVDAEVLGESHASPVFSTAAGLLSYEVRGFADVSKSGGAALDKGAPGKAGTVNKLFRWLSENF